MATGLEITEQRLGKEDPERLEELKRDLQAGEAENRRIATGPLKFAGGVFGLNLLSETLGKMGSGAIFSAGGSGLAGGLEEAMKNTVKGPAPSVTRFDANGVEYAQPGLTPATPAPGINVPFVNGPSPTLGL